jgi:sulfite exporter TauE/SafE
MRIRRFCVLFTMGLLAFMCGALHTPGATQPEIDKSVHVSPAKVDQPITLRDRLVVGLQLGHLPQGIVDETFFWARQRASAPRNGLKYRPIVFFQPGLKARAARIHVAL